MDHQFQTGERRRNANDDDEDHRVVDFGDHNDFDFDGDFDDNDFDDHIDFDSDDDYDIEYNFDYDDDDDFDDYDDFADYLGSWQGAGIKSNTEKSENWINVTYPFFSSFQLVSRSLQIASLHAPIHERQIVFPSSGDFARRVKALEPGHVKVTLSVSIADSSIDQVRMVVCLNASPRILSL